MGRVKEKYLEIQPYLNGVDTEIEDFSNKMCKGGFLRPAIISHIRYLFKISRPLASGMIDKWIEDKQIG